MRRQSDFGKVICPSCQCAASRRDCRNTQISGFLTSVLLPQRGALRDRHERWQRDAMDAACQQTNDNVADGEVVWSWRPDAGVNLAMMLRITPTTVARKPGHRGDYV